MTINDMFMLIKDVPIVNIGYGASAVAMLMLLRRVRTIRDWIGYTAIVILVGALSVLFVFFCQRTGELRQEERRHRWAEYKAEMWKAVAIGNNKEAAEKYEQLLQAEPRTLKADLNEFRNYVEQEGNKRLKDILEAGKPK